MLEYRKWLFGLFCVSSNVETVSESNRVLFILFKNKTKQSTHTHTLCNYLFSNTCRLKGKKIECVARNSSTAQASIERPPTHSPQTPPPRSKTRLAWRYVSPHSLRREAFVKSNHKQCGYIHIYRIIICQRRIANQTE